MASVLIICDTDLSKDPRVLRQVNALKSSYEIHTCGVAPTGMEKTFTSIYPIVDYHFGYFLPLRKIISAELFISARLRKIFRPLMLKVSSAISKNSYYERTYWTIHRKRLLGALKKLKPDLIIANDISTLPLAAKLKSENVKLVFDAHEYHPEELQEVEEWRINTKPSVIYYLKKYIHKADLMLTVSEPIAREYQKNFSVQPLVITNAPPYVELGAQKVGEKIRLIHHGAAIKERLLEETINVMRFLDENYSLDLMLVPTDENYLQELRSKYKNDSRIRFIPPVPTTEISKRINEYDIGIYILPPLNFNNINALPNKFFEFIQARLAVAIGPMPAMEEIVNNYKAGVVAKDFSSESLAEAIKNLSKENIFELKLNAGKAAKELSAEKNHELLLKEVKRLLS